MTHKAWPARLMSRIQQPDSGGTAVTQKADPEVKQPPRYKVVLNNDDYTPMDFVIDVLQKFFSMDNDKANQVMLTVHYQGKAVCGVYSRDIAETKVMQVNQYARAHEHPLLCTMEQA